MKQALIDNERTPGKHIAFAEDSLAEAKLIRYITGDWCCQGEIGDIFPIPHGSPTQVVGHFTALYTYTHDGTKCRGIRNVNLSINSFQWHEFSLTLSKFCINFRRFPNSHRILWRFPVFWTTGCLALQQRTWTMLQATSAAISTPSTLTLSHPGHHYCVCTGDTDTVLIRAPRFALALLNFR